MNVDSDENLEAEVMAASAALAKNASIGVGKHKSVLVEKQSSSDQPIEVENKLVMKKTSSV